MLAVVTAVHPEPDPSAPPGPRRPGLDILLRRRATEDGAAAAAYEPDGTSFTFSDLQDLAARVADRLPAARARVGLRLPNQARGVAAVHGCWQAGCVAVLLGPTLPSREVERRLEETGCVAFLDVESDKLSRLAPGSSRIGDDEAVVVFTSGTSGRPKGAVLGFRSLEGSLASISAGVGMPGGRRPITPARSPSPTFMTLAHVGGFLSTVTAMYLGKPSLIVDRWRVEEIFDLVDRFELSLLRLAPAMVHDLANAPGDRDLGPVRTISVGSAPLGEAVRRAVEDRYDVIVLDNYGQTELAGAIAFERYEDVVSGRRPPGSVGRVAPGVDVTIVDQHGRPLPTDEVGEIWARSSGALDAYIVDGQRMDPTRHGWVATGDLGRVDSDGFVYLLGRADDLIVCGGFNVYPRVVENALLRVRGIVDAAVVGMPDERLGQIPLAGIVVDPATETPNVDAELRDLLAPYELPRRVVRVARIPRNEAGKPDRVALRRLLESGVGGRL